jgi:hypothetical protein
MLNRYSTLRVAPQIWHSTFFLFRSVTTALLALCMGATANGQNALNGKLLYETPVVPGNPSCSNGTCHGPTPAMRQNKIQLGTKPNDILYAIDTVYKMSFLSGRLTQSQLADLAAYIENPDVEGRGIADATPKLANFGSGVVGDSGSAATYAVAITNTGSLPLIVNRISVSNAAFSVTSTTCSAAAALQPSRSCKVQLRFAPSALGTTTGELVVEHDGSNPSVRVALLGNSATTIPSGRRLMVEYVHAPLQYFFQTPRANEKATLDMIEEFHRTGEQFYVYAEPGADRSPIARYYFDKVARVQSRGSHFYTLLSNEREALRSLNPTNLLAPGLPYFEGDDSWAHLPVDGSSALTCPPNLIGVYRAFRGARFPDDPNHRFTASRAIYDSLVVAGWDGEGIVFCIPSSDAG